MANIQFQSDRTKNKGSEQRATGVRVFAYVLDRKNVSFRILYLLLCIVNHSEHAMSERFIVYLIIGRSGDLHSF